MKHQSRTSVSQGRRAAAIKVLPRNWRGMSMAESWTGGESRGSLKNLAEI